MAKVKITAAVTLQEQLAADIYDMRIKAPEIAESAVPGQFVSLYSKDGARILPRPISLCGIDKEKGELRLVYLEAGKKAFLIGGGIGVPPMLELAKALHELNKDEEDNLVQSVLGYRDSQMFLKDEFEAYGPVYAATEDGSFGTSGNVLDAIREQGLTADVIYACGPTPMLRALKAYAAEKGLECWLSLEEKMACGVGACLACVCRSKEVDDHSQVHNKRICKDGPVFRADEIEL